ncbi:two-component sensor histidine kinase [Burkholderia cenocepacia]|uniref:ATP-binding protein n=1 Tax=Burkholderia cenocepacia TaxID=95486 RepID=UPI00097C6591|nr:ATP-binding protein [Burkholderia cenocepacia]ONJ13509.1 two-component sensor histidine kinase [Burkholderia cenocepacia]ONJ30389.1 two-component sensor histidine kinase [Burkholderia cenocepacia]ONP23435.1 two-component sensor histidine kinase [Burkholderia cenocepacia]ONP34075.1 two-component sensor histidine kinase [Burkholderia cenocepacia]ONP34770.1 two-component sensor histidine kinase [Burkholderia cenocepacia]
MLRPLLRLYLVVILFVGASIIFIQLSFDRIFYERGAQAQRDSLTTYSFVLNDYLERHPGAQRELALRELALHGREGFGFMSMADARAQLSGAPLRDLDAGKIAISYNGKDYYMPLADGSVLHARPIEAPDLDIRIYAYMLLALATLFAVVLWIHYHWRDIRRLQDAARAFGAGTLSTRVKLSGKSNIYELSQQFNDMAARIEASIKQQREMMHGISHELKTPLARLEFGLALLADPDETGRMRERRDVRELDELVTELLTIGRLEQGASELAPMEVVVDALIDSVAGNVADDIADRGIALDVSTLDAPATHVCDPKLVARALLNLIRNGARYASRKVLLAATRDRSGALVLSVDDDGPGIPAAERARVFEPFQRLDSSRDRQTGGFGLGLAIVRRVAQVHGGDVRLEDSPLGGARFVITLPARALPDSLFDVAQHVESTHVDARRRSGTGTVVPLR